MVQCNMSTTSPTQWRISAYHSGDVAWLRGPTGGVLYRIKTITKHKYEVAFGGHFYRHWHTFGSALTKAEAKDMCENHAIASRVLKVIEDYSEDEIPITED